MSESPTDESLALCGSLHRRGGTRVTFSQSPPPPPPDLVRRPAHVARMLALAHHIQHAIDRGLVEDRATVAQELGLSRPRITQLLNLLTLAPELQLIVLRMEAIDGKEPVSEWSLRFVVLHDCWSEQRKRWAELFVAPTLWSPEHARVQPLRGYRLADGLWSRVKSTKVRKRKIVACVVGPAGEHLPPCAHAPAMADFGLCHRHRRTAACDSQRNCRRARHVSASPVMSQSNGQENSAAQGDGVFAPCEGPSAGGRVAGCRRAVG